MEYLVRIVHKTGEVGVVGMTHSQLCATIKDAPRPLPDGFWVCTDGVECEIGNVKLVDQERLAHLNRRH